MAISNPCFSFISRTYQLLFDIRASPQSSESGEKQLFHWRLKGFLGGKDVRGSNDNHPHTLRCIKKAVLQWKHTTDYKMFKQACFALALVCLVAVAGNGRTFLIVRLLIDSSTSILDGDRRPNGPGSVRPHHPQRDSSE